jgi:WD40 repeat protein
MDCEEMERTLSQKPLAELTDNERAAAEQHLAACPDCRGEWEPALQSQELHRTVRELCSTTSIRAGVMARVRGQKGGNPDKGDGPVVRERIAGFEVVGTLGRGGMGTVLKARQVSMDRFVALKILPKRLASNEDYVRRFVREARAAARLHHPHIVQAHDVGEDDGTYYFVMEYVDGEGLDAAVAREGPLEAERALQIMKQVCSALWAAHEAGIVHRDIKPANLMLDSKGNVRVTDFGLAKRTDDQAVPGSDLVAGGPPAESQALGTPAYVAPEVAGGRPAGPRSDLYSLGATFFHLLAGRAPFEGDDLTEVVRKQIGEAPPPLSSVAPRIDPRLCKVIDRLLAKDPDERPAAAQALLEELEGLGTLMSAAEVARAEGRAMMLRSAPTVPLPSGARAEAEAPPRPWRRRKWSAAAALFAVGLVVALWPRGRAPRSSGRIVLREREPEGPPARHPREQEADDLFRDAGDLALMRQWVDAKNAVKRLDEKYADTAFYKKQIVAIGMLRAKISSALLTDAPRKPTPALPEPDPLPEERGVWASLFDGKTLRGWRVVADEDFFGRWQVVGEPGRIVLHKPPGRAALAWMGEFPSCDYELSLEIMRESGGELCELLLPVGSERCGWNIDGWGGGQTGLSIVDGVAGHVNDTNRKMTCRDRQWHTVRVRVTAAKVEGWLDGEKLIDLSRDGRRLTQPFWIPVREPFAVTAWSTALSIRNIRVRRLAGEPEAPPADGVQTAKATVAVSGSRGWQDTGLHLTKGERYSISATGAWGGDAVSACGPTGLPRVEFRPVPLFGKRILDLVGRLGPQGHPFHIGSSLELTAARSGRLFLRMNDDEAANNWGSVRATIHGSMVADGDAPLLARFSETIARAKVRPYVGWVLSGIEVRRGDRVLISATGRWNRRVGELPADANGLNRSFEHLRAGALLGRVGLYGARVVVGKLHLLEAAEDGPLYLAVNEPTNPLPARLDHVMPTMEPADRPIGPDGLPVEPAPEVGMRLEPPAAVRLDHDPTGSLEVTVSVSPAFERRHKQPNKDPGPPFRRVITLTGHRHWVICAAFSPDGKLLATGSRDFTARLWDAATWRGLRTLRGHQETIESVAFSPDGGRLLTGSRDKSLGLWDVATGRRLRFITGHGEHVLSVAWFSDGNRAASTGDDRTVRIWDLAAGRPSRSLSCGAPSWCVAVSPDDRLVAMGCTGGWTRIWDAETGRPEQAFFAQMTNCWGLDFSPDGRRVAVVGDDPVVRVWDVATGRRLATLRADPMNRCVAFSPDGKWIAAGGGYRVVRLWDATTYEHVRSLEEHTSEVRGLAFSPDGRSLATVSFDCSTRVWTLAPGRPAAGERRVPKAKALTLEPWNDP